MLSKLENLEIFNDGQVYNDLVKYLEENPGSCPDDLLYLYIETNGIAGESESGFYPAAACCDLKIGGRIVKTHVDCLTDITLGDLRGYYDV